MKSMMQAIVEVSDSPCKHEEISVCIEPNRHSMQSVILKTVRFVSPKVAPKNMFVGHTRTDICSTHRLPYKYSNLDLFKLSL